MRLRSRFLATLLALMVLGCGQSDGAVPEPVDTSPTHSAAESGAPPASARPAASSASPSIARPAPSASAPATPEPERCSALVDTLTTRQQIGQLVMLGVSTSGPGSAASSVISERHLGSVVLLGNSTAGSKTIRRVAKQVRSSSGKPKGVGRMVAVDQEGGSVQRLRGPGFDRIPSAREQASLSDARLTSRARDWGDQLRRAGIDANLAPVADIVPRGGEAANDPSARCAVAMVPTRRWWRPRPRPSSVAWTKPTSPPRSSTSRGSGGCGATRTSPRTRLIAPPQRVIRISAASLQPWTGVDMVMISTATYVRIDDSRQAAFSKVVIEEVLRGDLGFTGVVISDDLATVGVSEVRESQRALRFLKAGGDLAIIGDQDAAGTMIDAVAAEAKSSSKFRAALAAKATRVLQLKERRGLADCE